MMRNWKTLGPGAAFFHEVMGTRFDFEGIVLTLQGPGGTWRSALWSGTGGPCVRYRSGMRLPDRKPRSS